MPTPGKLLQIRGLMLDITGLQHLPDGTASRARFFGKILNNTQSLILVADTAGLVSYANRRWYEAGYEQKELLGRPLLELVRARICSRVWPMPCKPR